MAEEVRKRGRTSFWIAAIALVIAVGIFIYFSVRMTKNNALEGTWYNAEQDLTITFKGDGGLEVKDLEAYKNTNIVPKVKYQMDKDAKTVSLDLTDESAEELSKALGGYVSSDDVLSFIGGTETKFDYSVSGDTLTLTGREYGQKTVLERK